MEVITQKEARKLVLASQKLIGSPVTPQQIIEHLGYIQIDTIAVVERAHHHVFWTRNHKYKPADLSLLVRKRHVFEYWSHAASFLPMKDYRYTLPMKRDFRKNKNAWFPRDVKLMSAILKRIKSEGPLRSKDFENTNKGAKGGWSLKPAKKALERLFMEGQLEITQRDGFQKVYDVPERVIPDHVDISMPTETEYIRFLIQRTLRHHGLATVEEVGYLKKRETKSKIEKVARAMVSDGELNVVNVKGVSKTYFVLPKAFEDLPKLNSKVLILSPFDNLVIQRQKLKDLFQYDYQIECYVPAAKRQFGYFCLPIFKGDRGVARIDCKADRKNKNLIVQSIHYEANVDRESLAKVLLPQLKSFAKFNGCQSVQWHGLEST